MKKVIIFYCVDNFNNPYKYAVKCDGSIQQTIAAQKRLSTEIVDHEVVNLSEGDEYFEYKKVHGGTHDDPALIFSLTEYTLYFRDNETGSIEEVVESIDDFEGRNGFFCIAPEDYEKAYEEIERHDIDHAIEEIARKLIDGLEEDFSCERMEQIKERLNEIVKDENLTLEDLDEMCWEDSNEMFDKIFG